jgi:predicted NBD/HSP70 family sugar kinase|tara:strand:- start:245 stop:1150 length:906 start_codon:yes stop_codon:yes gene_type:complete
MEMNNTRTGNTHLIECYDIGGTNIRGALIADGRIQKLSFNVETIKGNIASLVQQVKNISTALRKQLNHQNRVKAVSMGVPGPVKNGIMLGSKPLNIGEDVEFQYLLGDYFNVPLIVGNDLNMAARGELALGKYKGLQNFCLLTISTGIGVGIVINGTLYDRKTESGHNILETDHRLANPCLGHSGCWSAQSSGAAIDQTAMKLGVKMTTSEIFKDSRFQGAINKVREYNAHGIGSLVNAYDPEKIIVMGSLGLEQFDRIIPSAEMIRRYTLIRDIPEIVPTTLVENIGLYGAYFEAKNFVR